ncbi:hypothetical protein NSP_36930 [Nodularia spumigena CCY9414]|nr:hypothetical protein NSP_36930 [Nodularia spumigena CCY9414]
MKSEFICVAYGKPLTRLHLCSSVVDYLYIFYTQLQTARYN